MELFGDLCLALGRQGSPVLVLVRLAWLEVVRLVPFGAALRDFSVSGSGVRVATPVLLWVNYWYV